MMLQRPMMVEWERRKFLVLELLSALSARHERPPASLVRVVHILVLVKLGSLLRTVFLFFW